MSEREGQGGTPATGWLRRRLTALGDSFETLMRVLRQRGPSQVQFWFIALALGVISGYATCFFRLGIDAIQGVLYDTDDTKTLHSFAATLPWWWLVLVPVCGGLTVGLILDRFASGARARAVAEVIQGAALDRGRVELRAGLASAAASLITLSSGGSAGREGPVVHLAAVISTWVSQRIDADAITGRDLMGCAVAAAVSASFNAPIAGALFALEVVLRHFAVRAFAPIVIASVAGTLVSRSFFGDIAEFTLGGDGILSFYVELPAFLLLGITCGLVSVVMMKSVLWAEDAGDRAMRHVPLPRWSRPAIAGGLLGVLAIWYPHIIGVGYETTSAALTGVLGLREAVIFTVLKVAALAITMGGRMGGGMFSPSLMIGALTGLAFGLLATGAFPDVSGGPTLYALAGLGAVGASVLGAPISTTLIVLELTGDWQTGLAVMVAVSLSAAISTRLVQRSFFLSQLERRGIRMAAGPQAYLLSVHSAVAVMRAVDGPRAAPRDACEEMMSAGVTVAPDMTLETALPMFETGGYSFIPVVAPSGDGGKGELLGALFHLDALRAYNRALAETAAEEHS